MRQWYVLPACLVAVLGMVQDARAEEKGISSAVLVEVDRVTGTGVDGGDHLGSFAQTFTEAYGDVHSRASSSATRSAPGFDPGLLSWDACMAGLLAGQNAQSNTQPLLTDATSTTVVQSTTPSSASASPVWQVLPIKGETELPRTETLSNPKRKGVSGKSIQASSGTVNPVPASPASNPESEVTELTSKTSDNAAPPKQKASASVARMRASVSNPEFNREVTRALSIETLDPVLLQELQQAFQWYQGRARTTMQGAIVREAKLSGDLAPILSGADLPTWLTGIAAVETGFNHRAVAPSKHSGLWQFSADSARHFGLTVTAQRDERLDPEASTRAAARMLRFLYNRYDNWPLALAAFNVGYGRVDKALKARPGASVGSLVEAGLIPRATLTNVARYFAAASILEAPASFGFTPPSDRDAGVALGR